VLPFVTLTGPEGVTVPPGAVIVYSMVNVPVPKVALKVTDAASYTHIADGAVRLPFATGMATI